jgi:hypothetical protein
MLSLIVVAFSYWAWWLLKDAPASLIDLGQLALITLAGGTLGSAISCLLSACNRIANGWEFSRGEKYPRDDPADKFVARMFHPSWFGPSSAQYRVC